MSDEFFDDETELMDAAGTVAPSKDEGASASPAAGSGRAAKQKPSRTAAPEPAASTAAATDAATTKRTPPPFWMVLAIAAIALLLGVVIGYLLGSSATLSALEQQAGTAQTTQTTDDSYAMPEGHPEVTVDDDGTAHVVEDGASQDSATSTDAASE